MYQQRAAAPSTLAEVYMTQIVAYLAAATILVMVFQVAKHRESQPLRIKSPTLLSTFLVANALTILFLSTLQLNSLYCSRDSCVVWLQDTSKVIGLLIVCFSEPLLIVSYALRFISIHRIFDAQERYFKTGVRPSAMIKRYSDPVLAMSALTLISVLASVYTVLAVVVWDFGANGYGYLPTYALSTEVIDNQHNFISLMYLVCSTLVVGLIFAYLLDKSRQIRKEFATLSTELQLVTAIWLTLTDAVLLFVIQGSFLGWFNDITYYRVAFWLLTIRSIAISFIAAWRPIREARS